MKGILVLIAVISVSIAGCHAHSGHGSARTHQYQEPDHQPATMAFAMQRRTFYEGESIMLEWQVRLAHPTRTTSADWHRRMDYGIQLVDSTGQVWMPTSEVFQKAYDLSYPKIEKVIEGSQAFSFDYHTSDSTGIRYPWFLPPGTYRVIYTPVPRDSCVVALRDSSQITFKVRPCPTENQPILGHYVSLRESSPEARWRRKIATGGVSWDRDIFRYVMNDPDTAYGFDSVRLHTIQILDANPASLYRVQALAEALRALDRWSRRLQGSDSFRQFSKTVVSAYIEEPMADPRFAIYRAASLLFTTKFVVSSDSLLEFAKATHQRKYVKAAREYVDRLTDGHPYSLKVRKSSRT